MVDALFTAYALHRQGKLHKRLIFRLTFLTTLSLIFGYITLHDIILRGFHWYVSMGVFCAGFLIGLLFFSHVFVIKWDEEREIVAVGRLDTTGIVVLLVYLSVRLWVKFFLEEHYRNIFVVSAITFAALFGVMTGRLIGALIAIHRAHQLHEEQHTPPNT